MISFKAYINPFLQSITIEGCMDDKSIVHSLEITYEDLDEWNTFSMFGKTYDTHFLYDTRPELSIYEVVNNECDYSSETQQQVTLIVKI